jgi:hypothetical protein
MIHLENKFTVTYLVSVCPEMRFFEVGVYALPLRVLICSKSGKRVYETPRTAKKISTGAPKEVPLGCIYLIWESPFYSAYLRALFFEHDAEIEQKDHLWTGTS